MRAAVRAEIGAMGTNLFVSPRQIVEKSAALANADKRWRISVAGPDSLAAMVALCRAGFDHVECAKQATCRCADEASDLLIVAGAMSSDERAAVLRRTGRLLRDGGVLVVQLERPSDAPAVRAALGAAGMGISSTVFDLSAGCLVTHTVERAAASRRRLQTA
jgi:hypothetical protein